MRILFICHKNNAYGVIHSEKKNSGLFTSTEYVAEGLRERGVHATVALAIDGNCIDRLVHEHKPDVVVIEAIWVVPSKFEVLKRLHKKVRWFVHLHSNIPFLQMEGMAMEWLPQYPFLGVGIIVNSKHAYTALRTILRKEALHYLPNIYKRRTSRTSRGGGALHVACFGAIRPLKNQLNQALAAIELARQLDRPLVFHMNGTRTEQKGEAVLKNIRALFHNRDCAHLKEHPWYHPDSLHYVLRTMDIGMQVSLTETFNIISADIVSAGLPIVVSKSIPWVSRFSYVEVDDVDDMVRGMRTALSVPAIVRLNQYLLKRYSAHAQNEWVRFVEAC